MRVIISHDVDHLLWSEHLLKDLYIPKYAAKLLWYSLARRVPAHTIWARAKAMTTRRINRLEELVRFNKSRGIPATFFVGMANGLGLSYSYKAASEVVHWLVDEGCEVGVHGIAYDSKQRMQVEYDRFARLGQSSFGMRTHYLRRGDDTLGWAAELGYAFTSLTYGEENPHLVNGMWEFPISLMDAYVARPHQLDLTMMKDMTMRRVDMLAGQGTHTLTINFHDLHYSEAYQEYAEWYEWLVDMLAARGCRFESFQEAMKGLYISPMS